jgi:O-antigen/teichoic acid export membrane protein
MASLLATGNHRSHADFVKRSCLYAMLAGIVVAAGGLLLAPYIIRIIAGSDYDGAIMPLRLLVIALIPQFISQVMIYQVLVPMKRDSVLLGISLSGCLLYILFNFLFVPHLAAVGSSVTLLLCELTVMTVYIIYCHRKRLLQFTSTQ